MSASALLARKPGGSMSSSKQPSAAAGAYTSHGRLGTGDDGGGYDQVPRYDQQGPRYDQSPRDTPERWQLHWNPLALEEGSPATPLAPAAGDPQPDQQYPVTPGTGPSTERRSSLGSGQGSATEQQATAAAAGPEPTAEGGGRHIMLEIEGQPLAAVLQAAQDNLQGCNVFNGTPFSMRLRYLLLIKIFKAIRSQPWVYWEGLSVSVTMTEQEDGFIITTTTSAEYHSPPEDISSTCFAGPRGIAELLLLLVLYPVASYELVGSYMRGFRGPVEQRLQQQGMLLGDVAALEVVLMSLMECMQGAYCGPRTRPCVCGFCKPCRLEPGLHG